MKKSPSLDLARRIFRLRVLWTIVVVLLLVCASPAGAQKNKKKQPDTPPADSSTTTVPMSDEQLIDYTLSEMLGAWQVGDVEKLHKDYADDVSIVSGSWGPPIIGWNNYAVVYQQQRARMQQVRFDRSNTFVKVIGTFAWACYQWDFGAIVDGQPVASQGQTTVVLEKRANHWVIVHNHTSFVQGGPAALPTNITPLQPTKPSTP